MQTITPESADQIIKRKPWPIYSTFPHCSGPCEQGRRLCTTPEACQTGEADEWKPLSLRDHLMFWVPVLTITGGLLAFVLHAAGVLS